MADLSQCCIQDSTCSLLHLACFLLPIEIKRQYFPLVNTLCKTTLFRQVKTHDHLSRHITEKFHDHYSCPLYLFIPNFTVTHHKPFV